MTTLLDPRNVDVADLLAAIRDITGRIDDIDRSIDAGLSDLGEQVDHLAQGVTALVTALAKRPGGRQDSAAR
jgi:hypothetical protein